MAGMEIERSKVNYFDLKSYGYRRFWWLERFFLTFKYKAKLLRIQKSFTYASQCRMDQ